ncbi:MAG: amidohydrolase [Emergencia sp.]|nr:amidohydrolase [Emergencia sp.]
MDKLYYNGKIYSIDKDNRQYSSIGVKDGKIAFLGSDAQADKIDAVERIDLEGKTVLPGFIDSHLHLLNYAFLSESYKMFEVDSIQNVIDEGKRLAENMKDSEPDTWLYGRGWNQENFTDEKRFLTKHDLDRISTERPILLIRVCGHVAAVNSKGLEIVLGMEHTKEYIKHIDIENGILTEASVKLCYNAMDVPSVDKVKNMILGVQPDFSRCGITSVESDNFLSLPGRDRKAIVKAHQELDAEGKLRVRIREQGSFTCFEDMKEYIDDGYRTGDGSDYYRIGPVKLYEDGSLGGRTALLKEPYVEDGDNCGTMIHDEADLQNCVDYAYDHDMQIIIHSIGDQSTELVCSAYEKAIKKFGQKNLRLAINHLQIVGDDIFDRMKENEILAYIQPVFVASDKETLRSLVGEDREKNAYAWKSMLEKGLHCCGGSDAPVESFDILEGIQVAVTRDRLDQVTDGWKPEEKLSVLEAVRLFTIDSAYGAFEEEKKGSLEIGKLADMVVLGEDVFEIDPHRIAQIPVLRTIVGGEEVYLA